MILKEVEIVNIFMDLYDFDMVIIGDVKILKYFCCGY